MIFQKRPLNTSVSPNIAQEQQRSQQQQAFTESHQKELDLLSILHGSQKNSPTKAQSSHRDTTDSSSNSAGVGKAIGANSGGFNMDQFAFQASLPKPSNMVAQPPVPKVFDCAELESVMIRNKSSNDLNLASARFNEMSMREIKSFPNLRNLSDIEQESRHLPDHMLNLNQTPKGGAEQHVSYTYARSVPTKTNTNQMSPNMMGTSRTALAAKDQQKIAIAGDLLNVLCFEY